MKPDETFCLTCNKVYKRRDNDIFGYLCLECDEKEVNSVIKLTHKNLKSLYHKGSERRDKISKQQQDIVMEGMTLLFSSMNGPVSVSQLANWIRNNRNFPYGNKGNETLYSIKVSDSLIRKIINKLIKQNKLKKMYPYKTYHKYSLV